VSAFLCFLPAVQAQVINGFATNPRVVNAFPSSTLVVVNPGTNPDVASINDSNFGATGGGQNRTDLLASADNGATPFTFNTNQGFKISTTLTLTDGTDSPRKEAGIRINNSVTGDALFIVDSDQQEIVAFGGGAPFHSFANVGSPGGGYKTGTPITLSEEYDPPGLVDPLHGLLTYTVSYPTLGLSQSYSALFSNLEGGPGNGSTFGVYGETDGSSNATTDFVNTSFATITASLVPEPASLAVIGLGGLSLLARRRASR
jgi:hypothetical protein